MFGTDGLGYGSDDSRFYNLNSADVVCMRMEAWHLLWDYRVLKDVRARAHPLLARDNCQVA